MLQWGEFKYVKCYSFCLVDCNVIVIYKYSLVPCASGGGASTSRALEECSFVAITTKPVVVPVKVTPIGKIYLFENYLYWTGMLETIQLDANKRLLN